jgi:uncharacterized protein
MILHSRVRRLSTVIAASAILAFSVPAFAQQAQDNIPESQLKAARAAVAAIHATDSFDNIQPQAAAALEEQLIQKNPDLQELISKTIDEKTMALAARRADLEKEAATAYAKIFTEQELNEIANFYNSPTGKKLLDNGPIVTRQLVDAANIWQNGIARDLAQQVAAAITAATPAAPSTDASGAAAPADGTTGTQQ